jgi:ABC-type branched-subunit amino acid transport system ATPase component
MDGAQALSAIHTPESTITLLPGDHTGKTTITNVEDVTIQATPGTVTLTGGSVTQIMEVR